MQFCTTGKSRYECHAARRLLGGFILKVTIPYDLIGLEGIDLCECCGVQDQHYIERNGLDTDRYVIEVK